MITIYLDILGCNFMAEVEYRVTSKGCPEQGPSYSSGGEPAEPPEWEIEEIGLYRLAADDKGPLWLEVPKWLFNIVAGSYEVNQAIIEEIADEDKLWHRSR